MQSVVCWQKKNDSFLFQNQYTAFIRVCIFFSETPFKKKKKLDRGLFGYLCIGVHTNAPVCEGRR